MKNLLWNKKKTLVTTLIILSMLILSTTLGIAISINNEDGYELKTSVDPADAGYITLDPPGGLYKPGTIVTATAVANTNGISQGTEYKFDHWSGDASGRSESVEILMDNDKAICAHFVKNNDGGGDSALFPPVADFEYEPSHPEVMEEVTFDASKSYDPDGGELKKYIWTYTKEDDYSSVVNMGEGKIIKYFWQNPGLYNVELYVEDDEGEHSTIEKTVIVGNPSDTPILAYEPNQFDFEEIKIGDEINGEFQVWNRGEGTLEFTCAQKPDIQGNQLLIQFNPDHGTSTGVNDRVTIEFSIETTNAEPGVYTEEIIITSTTGEKGDISLYITLIDPSNDREPVADFTFTPLNPKIKETVLFDASNSYDPDGGEITDYTWSYTSDDAYFPVNMGKGVKIEYSWETPGKYYVTLTITDDEENKASIVKEVDVKDSDDNVYYSIELAIEPENGGSVELNPPGYKYLEGTKVLLTATPNTGYKFQQWEGNITDTNPTVEIVMDSDKKIVARFESLSGKYVLDVDVSPENAGTVTLNPPGGIYEPDEIVTLTANANEKYKFDHWTGDATGNDPVIEVKMNSDKHITAVFTLENPPEINVNIISPQYSCLYIGENVIPINTSKSITPIILLSGINIYASAEGAIGDVTFEFYIDDELKHSETVSSNMANYTWDEKAFLRHNIRVVATDENGSSDEASMDVIIFNFG